MSRNHVPKDESPYPEIAYPRKRAFLAAFQETGNVRQASRGARVGRSTHYRWLSDDPAYREAVQIAKEVAADRLEDEAMRRAVDGVVKPVGWYKGKPGGYVREYSDKLLIFLLKRLRPDKYAGRIQYPRVVPNIDVSKLPNHALQRIAAGEHPLQVLASLVPGELLQSRTSQ